MHTEKPLSPLFQAKTGAFACERCDFTHFAYLYGPIAARIILVQDSIFAELIAGFR
jgi:hypothetical protein